MRWGSAGELIQMDIVVPSARPPAVTAAPLNRLGQELDAAGISPEQVLVVDDRPGAKAAERRHGLPVMATAGAVGPGRARNLGAARGRSPWILFVDDDVLLDHGTMVAFISRAGGSWEAVATIGGLRPPETAPGWLTDCYADGVLTPASQYLPSGPVVPTSLASALLLVQREAFELVGGFPELPFPAFEDPLLGVRIDRAGLGPVHRDSLLRGVHLYEPTWREWLQRNYLNGRRLASMAEFAEADEVRALIRSVTLEGGATAAAKRAFGHVPLGLLRLARTRLPRKAAAAGAFARGFREATGR